MQRTTRKPPMSGAKPPSGGGKKSCPQCGTKVAAGATRCTKCGYRF